MSVFRRAASGAGAVLAGATRTVAAVRDARKPLHPRGIVGTGTLVREGGAGTGAAWLDEPGRDAALVRRSRAVGLPTGWPDIHGLAIRVDLGEAQVADILLASTGASPTTRFALTAGRRPESLFLGSLLPYRSPVGPVLLGARPGADRQHLAWDLVWALGRGPWARYGRLTLEDELPGTDTSFDPVLHLPPGLDQYAAVARLRRPAYRTARRSRGEGP